jgi:hypothetical protein
MRSKEVIIMVESEYYDDRYQAREPERVVTRRNHSNLGSLLLVALVPIAFFAGWVANANTNPQGTGFEAGVGGGPDNNTNNERQVSPTEQPEQVVTATPTTTPTPTIEVSPTTTEEE